MRKFIVHLFALLVFSSFSSVGFSAPKFIAPDFFDFNKSIKENFETLSSMHGGALKQTTFEETGLGAGGGVYLSLLGNYLTQEINGPIGTNIRLERRVDIPGIGSEWIPLSYGYEPTLLLFDERETRFYVEMKDTREGHWYIYSLEEMFTKSYVWQVTEDIIYQPTDQNGNIYESTNIKAGSYIFAFEIEFNDFKHTVFGVFHAPIPGAAVMLGTGLAGLVAMRRRKV